VAMFDREFKCVGFTHVAHHLNPLGPDVVTIDLSFNPTL